MHEPITDLIGKTLELFCLNSDNTTLCFYDSDQALHYFYHAQDCCEHVYLADITGDLNDLIGSPIVEAELVSSWSGESKDGDYTWTFYRLSTVKGTVVLRWYGSSNGFYSTEVSYSYQPAKKYTRPC